MTDNIYTISSELGADIKSEIASLAAANMSLSSALIVVSFGFVALLFTFILLRGNRNSWDVIRAIGIVVILVLSVLLMILGYSKTQVTEIIGLFGAIAGYLLGKSSSGSERDSVNKDEVIKDGINKKS